jgi:hypothetical protein
MQAGKLLHWVDLIEAALAEVARWVQIDTSFKCKVLEDIQ